MSETKGRGAALVVRAQHDPLVDQAIRRINDLWRRGVLDTVVAVGDYLIEEFFGGDLDEALQLRPRRPVQLARLYERARELPVSAHALKRAIRIAAQYHALPTAVAERLSKTQHELLLPVADLREKRRLAERALRERLTTRDLERRVREIHQPHAGGRPSKAPLLRRTDALLRAAVAPGLGEELSARELAQLTAAEIRDAETAIRRARESLERIADALARHPRD